MWTGVLLVMGTHTSLKHSDRLEITNSSSNSSLTTFISSCMRSLGIQRVNLLGIPFLYYDWFTIFSLSSIPVLKDWTLPLILFMSHYAETAFLAMQQLMFGWAKKYEANLLGALSAFVIEHHLSSPIQYMGQSTFCLLQFLWRQSFGISWD